jgi:hypothetical protein
MFENQTYESLHQNLFLNKSSDVFSRYIFFGAFLLAILFKRCFRFSARSLPPRPLPQDGRSLLHREEQGSSGPRRTQEDLHLSRYHQRE